MIYYTYLKETGEYTGSGTPLIDNTTHACTTKPIPAYDPDSSLFPFWDGIKWTLKERIGGV